MSEKYNHLGSEFIKAICIERSGKPDRNACVKWIRKAGHKINNDAFAKMWAGKLVYERHLVALFDYVRELDERDHCFRAFNETLISLGLRLGVDSSIEEILGVVCGPLSRAGRERTTTIDYLYRVVKHFEPSIALGSWFPQAVNAENLHETIEWMYVRGAEHLHPDIDCDNSEKIAISKAHIGIDLDEYVKRAREWLDWNPWTIVRARNKRGPVGMSIVLPLSDAAREKILRRDIATYDVTPKDFEIPANTLHLESCLERPMSMGCPVKNPTKQMFMALMMQESALWGYRANPNRDVLRQLSFGGTPQNRERLLDVGFKPLGIMAKQGNVELMELKVPIRLLQDHFVWLVPILMSWSECFDSPPMP